MQIKSASVCGVGGRLVSGAWVGRGGVVGVLAGWWVGGAPGVVGVGFDFGAEAGGRQGGDTWAVTGKIYTARKLLCDSFI